ncbi:hypothetical protein L596_012047 [Steinernema carpocapsae]|uniref:Uncharacterized protein n=1 Tax=Steinernema carpocapsae TaxID=34508 RepID=A0A4U5NVU4_STECR|nr:hypothetical protein L596_012047 [Steinernema carpocapsae]
MTGFNSSVATRAKDKKCRRRRLLRPPALRSILGMPGIMVTNDLTRSKNPNVETPAFTTCWDSQPQAHSSKTPSGARAKTFYQPLFVTFLSAFTTSDAPYSSPLPPFLTVFSFFFFDFSLFSDG